MTAPDTKAFFEGRWWELKVMANSFSSSLELLVTYRDL
jgi:hypothetical protein